MSEPNEIKENLIVDLTFKFALDIIKHSEILETNRKYNLSNQLFRSGTSIGANVREAQGAESLPDFIHKLKIAYKEAEETEYWILLNNQSTNYPDNNEILEKVISIKKVLAKIIVSSKNKLKDKTKN